MATLAGPWGGLLHQEAGLCSTLPFTVFPERDAFDTLFDHAPDKLNVVKKVSKRCLGGRGGREGGERGATKR